MISLEIASSILINVTMIINLQMARERVSQMATVWIITVKLVWNTMKMPHAKEYCRGIYQKHETNTLPWKTKDRIVDEICQEKDDP